MSGPEENGRIASRASLQALALSLLVLFPFLPGVPGGWLWDDDNLVTANVQVTRADGLPGIWLHNTSPDYFPLTTTTFWMEYRLWGDWSPGYRAVNACLHAVNAVLVWRVLLALGVPGAWVAALLWGLHPVTVSSVSWIAERKNTLSMACACMAVLAWLRADDRVDRRASLASLAWFVAALLAKSSLVSLPLVLPLLSWWRRGRLERADLVRTIPFLAASFILGLVTLWYQLGHSSGPSPGLVAMAGELFPRGLVLAGRAVGFYLWKDVWPTRLAMVYPRWSLDPTAPLSYVPTLLLVGVLVLLWRARSRTWAWATFLSLASFVLLLAPVLGFLPATFMKSFSFVADHWQYVALVAPVALVVAGAWRVVPAGPGRVALVSLVAAVLAMLTAREASLYADGERLWRHAVNVSDTWAGHTGLARALLAKGRTAEAIVEARRAVGINPVADPAWEIIAMVSERLGRHGEAAEAYVDIWKRSQRHSLLHEAAVVLAKGGLLEQAETLFDRAVPLLPGDAAVRTDHGSCLERLGRHAEAERSYREALAIDAENAAAQNGLAFLLVSRPGGDVSEALDLASRASRATGDADPSILDTLATAHAAAGDFASAVRVGEDALALARDAGDEALAAEILARVELFRAGKPFVAP